MLLALSLLANAATIHVDPDSVATSPDGTLALPYATVSDALAAASTGDTLLLADGTYAAPVTVNVGVTIQGAADLTSTMTKPWKVTATGATLDGLRFVGAGVGTAVTSTKPFTLQNSQIESFQVGIKTDGVRSSTWIRNNRVVDTLYPMFIIRSGWSTYVMVENNVLVGTGGGIGIYAYDSRWRGYHNAIIGSTFGVYHYLPVSRNLPVSYLHANLIVASSAGVYGANTDPYELKVYTNAITAPTAVSGVPSADQIGTKASNCGLPSGKWDHGYEPSGDCVNGALFGNDPDGSKADIGPYGGPRGGPWWLDFKCRGTNLDCPPDLDSWLASRSDVRGSMVFIDLYDSQTWDGYDDWSPELRRDLRRWFLQIYYDKAPILTDPPPHIGATSGSPKPQFTWDDGRNLYLSNIAQSLVVELNDDVPWSLDDYDSDTLHTLFDYQDWHGFAECPALCSYPSSWSLGIKWTSVPAPGPDALAAIEDAGLVDTTRAGTIANVLEFLRDDVRHFGGDITNYAVSDYYWNYPGVPLMAIWDGTDPVGPHPESGLSVGFLRWTGGCHSTNRFLQHALRPINIPVGHVDAGVHATPHFQSEDKWMSHGDDPYSLLSQSIHDGEELLISDATYTAWFGPGGSSANIGRRSKELGVEHLAPYLRTARCGDFAAGTSKAAGTTLATITPAYTLAELTAMGFWEDLDATIVTEGTCSVPMPLGSG